MTPSDEVRDAHHRVLRWSHVLDRQVSRLYDARHKALASHERVLESKFYGHKDAWPFFEMDAEVHFALVAARQLLRALQAFDNDDRLPSSSLDGATVRLVRDALEHWDEPTGRAASAMRQLGAVPSSHRFSPGGPGVLGELVSDAVLQAWARSVYEELVRWDPW